MEILPHTKIDLPDPTSNYSYKRSYFCLFSGNEIYFLFNTEKKAISFAHELTKSAADIEEELRHIETIVFSYFKASNFSDIQEQRKSWIKFESLQNSYLNLYRPYIKWHFVWMHINNIIDSLMQIIDSLPDKKKHLGLNPTIKRLQALEKNLPYVGLEKAHKVLKWNKGNPTVINPKDFIHET